MQLVHGNDALSGGEGPGDQPAAESGGDPKRVGLTNYIDSLEREALMQALEECRYNKTAAAKKLGITFRAMRYRLKKLGIE